MRSAFAKRWLIGGGILALLLVLFVGLGMASEALNCSGGQLSGCNEGNPRSLECPGLPDWPFAIGNFLTVWIVFGGYLILPWMAAAWLVPGSAAELIARLGKRDAPNGEE